MNNVFLSATINDTRIYIKCNKDVVEALHDILHDNGYKLTKTSPEMWDYYIEDGLSYEVDTIEEVNEFIDINNTAKEIRR